MGTMFTEYTMRRNFIPVVTYYEGPNSTRFEGGASGGAEPEINEITRTGKNRKIESEAWEDAEELTHFLNESTKKTK